MAFDSLRGRTVMFGGQASGPLLGDTWEWDGTNWIQRSSGGPPARALHAMAFDSQRNRTVLFGGYVDQQGRYFGDTWEWDGTVWTQIVPQYSAPRMRSHSMAFDSLRNRVVLLLGQLDGLISNPPSGDTWEWDGSNWLGYGAISSPPARLLAAMAFHAQRGRSVVFGGVTPPGGPPVQIDLADTWEWGGPSQVATVQPFGAGCGQPALSAAAAPGSLPRLATVYGTDVTNIPGSVAFMALGLSSTVLGAFSLPLPLDGFGLTGCWLYHDCIDLAEPCVATGSGSARHVIGIPNNNVLLGVVVFLQAWAPAPAANPAGIIASNALRLTVGNL
jgi:hypothetical protein